VEVFYGAVGEVGENRGSYEGEVEASVTVWGYGNLKRQSIQFIKL